MQSISGLAYLPGNLGHPQLQIFGMDHQCIASFFIVNHVTKTPHFLKAWANFSADLNFRL